MIVARNAKEAYAGMLRPGGEAVLVERELGLEVLHDGLILEEEDGAVTVREALDSALGGGELVCRNNLLEDIQGDIPELLVLVSEQEDSLSNAVRHHIHDDPMGSDTVYLRGCSGC